MPKYLYASPILPGKTELVTQVHRQKREHPEFEKEGEDLGPLIGLHNFEAWVNRTHRGDFFIHSLECNDFEEVFCKLREQIENKHPKALWVRNFYLDSLGKDYGHASSTPEVECVLDLTIPNEKYQQSPMISRGFCYPLLPTKVHDHREFCRQCMGEHRMRVEDSCAEFGVVKHEKFIQKTPHQDYIVIYQQVVAWTPEEQKQVSERAAKNPSWRWMCDVLQQHTGLTNERLAPHVEPLTQSAAAKTTSWQAPALATP